MQIPETPATVTELDLMKRLDDYASGKASWDENSVGPELQAACRTLHTNLSNLVNGLLAYILDRVTAREMETFTMHDRVHGRKVAHLMWHILKPERRDGLTPPEIGMLLVAAHLHDLGMGLSPAERATRLAPDSDLWDRLEIDENTKTKIEQLRTQIGDARLSDRKKRLAEQQLFQAEEALLTQDTRERHASKQRYEQILELLDDFHSKNPTNIPDLNASLSFDGDSFRDKLIDVCASHNEDADALVGNDETNLDRPRFPRDFPVGRCNADLQTVAAALRLADILDFDRERTPAVLFHYLLPNTWDGDNRSILEWSKHLAVSNWHIEKDDIVFRGRSKSHIIHHAVVQFCYVIAEEIKATHATFSALAEKQWPFLLPLSVKADIHEEGYRYVPYKFELDDARVYSLLMGGAIYDNPLVAVRELIQNAVDACKLRDSLTRLYEQYEEPGTLKRIFIRYEEPTDSCPLPKLIVTDTGTGMDAYTLERYFLKVGRSYYNSSDFNQFRVQLRKQNLDFAPVSEFGIGFLSTFLLADHVVVKTAMWEPVRGDTIQRTLKIDGPTRLIRLDENRNEGVGRFKGTRITLYLSPKIVDEGVARPATWRQIEDYVRETCQDLPYRLNLEYVVDGNIIRKSVDPLPLTVKVHPTLEESVVRIPIDESDCGVAGEIVLVNSYLLRRQELDNIQPVISGNNPFIMDNVVLRGGFNIGSLENLPVSVAKFHIVAGARLRLNWLNTRNKRYLTPNLARNAMADENNLEETVFRLWLTYLIKNRKELPLGLLQSLIIYGRIDGYRWLEDFDALTVYELARQGWLTDLLDKEITSNQFQDWENRPDGSLPYAFYGISRNLLDLIMPRVAKLQLNEQNEYSLRIVARDWRAAFDGWKSYISKPFSWGQFCEYLDGIESLLYFQTWRQKEYLNSKYHALFESWTQGDLETLRSVLVSVLLADVNNTFLLPNETFDLIRRAIDVAGDFEIGTARSHRKQTIKLNQLKVAQLQ